MGIGAGARKNKAAQARFIGLKPNINLNTMVIGIDVGISTTKIVGIENNKVIAPTRIKATDPVTSLYGGFGKFLYENKVSLADVEQVMLTGVGAGCISENIYGIPTKHVDEFVADAIGAQYGSGLDKMIVTSMGTGTTLVHVDNGEVHHLGGLGIGGGTLAGLAKTMLGTTDILHMLHLAENGDQSKVNLVIGDISDKPLPGLPMDATASLFGNIKSDAEPCDIALGIIWLVLQTIGSATYLASLKTGIRNYVMIGNVTKIPQARQIFDSIEPLYGVKYIIPEHSDYCTAIGAALNYYNTDFKLV